MTKNAELAAHNPAAQWGSGCYIIIVGPSKALPYFALANFMRYNIM